MVKNARIGLPAKWAPVVLKYKINTVMLTSFIKPMDCGTAISSCLERGITAVNSHAFPVLHDPAKPVR